MKKKDGRSLARVLTLTIPYTQLVEFDKSWYGNVCVCARDMRQHMQ